MEPKTNMDTGTLREDIGEILDNQESVELRCIEHNGETIYIDGKNNTYNSRSFLEKFENNFNNIIKSEMSVSTKQATKNFMEAIVGVIFNEFEGKKIGEDFTIQDCVQILMGNVEENDSPPKDPPKEEKKKEKKEKKPRKKSGYNVFIAENKEMLNEKISEILKETGQRKTPPSIAGPLWKALSDEEKKVYNDKAAALE